MDHRECGEPVESVVSVSPAPAGMKAVWSMDDEPIVFMEPVLGFVTLREVCREHGTAFKDDAIVPLLLNGNTFIYENISTEQIVGYSIPGDGYGDDHWRSLAKEYIEREKRRAADQRSVPKTGAES